MSAKQKNTLKDHREIGQEQDLFTTSELVGPGLPLFTPKGGILRHLIEEYMHNLLEKYGYEHVWIPHIARKKLYEISGHLEKFKEDMFPVMEVKEREYILKAMNCPHHIQIYARKPMSYRELPQRYAETSTVYRSEQSGELGGLTRVLSISIDDAHVFCTKAQVKEEFKKAMEINKEMLRDFGFEEYWVRLSLRNPQDKEKYLGDDRVWNEMEDLMRDMLSESGTPFKEARGEAAFYGPKMDLMAIDSHGREWQLSTIQLDFNLPERFQLTYIGEDGKEHRPYMLHRATLGSVERFLGVWLEHIQGVIPVWLAPIQALVIPIADRNNTYAQNILGGFKENGLRTGINDRSETLQAKIRDAQNQKIPYMLVVGDKEEKEKTVAVRLRTGEDLGGMKPEEAMARIKAVIEAKSNL